MSADVGDPDYYDNQPCPECYHTNPPVCYTCKLGGRFCKRCYRGGPVIVEEPPDPTVPPPPTDPSSP